MKKLFTLLILLVGVLSAQAADYDLRVAGVVVTDANKNNITGSGISGKVTYNSSSKTCFWRQEQKSTLHQTVFIMA